MPAPRIWHSFIRFGYKHFYNRFAFTYDFVSALVSRGDWRTWTAAALPFVRGPHILEVAFGTGNLQLDLHAAGFAPCGVDLSPYMVAITRRKLQARQLPLRLVRARAQQLPFPTGHFDSLVMTFPPGFITDALVLAELRRVLAPAGHLIWVDIPYLYPRDPWSRFLNWAFHITGGAAEPPAREVLETTARSDPSAPRLPAVAELLPRAGWSWQIVKTARRAGYIHVFIGTPTEVGLT